MKQVVIIFIFFFSINANAQIVFEKGYIINNSGQKFDCLIKNIDWINNPKKIEYKNLNNDESVLISIQNLEEFGIYNQSKYIRRKVKIDKSKDDFNYLKYDKNPVFVEEVLLLKVLVESQVSLYSYHSDGLEIFFISKKESNELEQLINKSYLISESQVGINALFRQQLWKNLKCVSIGMDKFDKILYSKRDLIQLIDDCYQTSSNTEKKTVSLFNLNVMIHLTNASLSVQNSVSSLNNFSLEAENNFNFGVEGEFILPYNKNKWGITVASNFQRYKSEKILDINVANGKLNTNIDYKSIEFQLGLRHYFFLNNNSKLFVNYNYLFDFNSKSTIVFKRNDGTIYNSLDLKSRNNMSFGLGYKFHDKYGVEFRYYTDRNILGDYLNWSTGFKSISLIFGYSIL